MNKKIDGGRLLEKSICFEVFCVSYEKTYEHKRRKSTKTKRLLSYGWLGTLGAVLLMALVKLSYDNPEKAKLLGTAVGIVLVIVVVIVLTIAAFEILSKNKL